MKHLLLCALCLPPLTAHAGQEAPSATPVPIEHPQTAPISIYVAPSAKRGAAGTAKDPATLADARELVRKIAGKKPVEVVLAAGTYELSEPFVFGPADSGTKEAPVVWRAADDAKVVFSAGRALKLDWHPGKNGIFTAKVPDGVADFDQLFVNGQRRILARFPNFDPKAKICNGVSAASTAPQRVKTWAHPEGGFVHAMHNGLWGDFHYEITGATPEGKLKLKGGTQNNRPEAGPSKSNRFVENIREELDSPDEWYFDKATRALSYFPPKGLDLANAAVAVPQHESAVRFVGAPGRPVRYVTLRGVTITHTLRTFMKTAEPLLRSDWRICRQGAAYFSHAEDCAVADCDFESVGGNAVFIDGYNRADTVSGCLIREAGASGVAVVGSVEAARGPVFNYSAVRKLETVDLAPGPKSEAYPRDCLVRDCLILHTGRVEKQSAGVTIDMAARTRVESSTIADVPRSGINIGEGAFGGHVVKDCDIFDTVLETSDHGAFNSWGRDRFWNSSRGTTAKWVEQHPELKFLDVRETNVLDHNRWRCDHGWDVDLDDGSSNYRIENNLLLHGGLKLREGYGRTARNNIMVDNTILLRIWYPASGDLVEKNIFFTPYLNAGVSKEWGGVTDKNFLHKPGAATGPATALRALSGKDAASVTGDAGFTDPAKGDYSLKPGSPALALGFVNFPMSFGVVSPRLKALAPSPRLNNAGLAKEASTRDARTVPVLGATVKNLAGLDDLSSTGMIRETGVVVLEIPEDSALFKLGVRQNDVILGWENAPVEDIAGLGKAAAGKPAPKNLVIWRDQRKIIVKP